MDDLFSRGFALVQKAVEADEQRDFELAMKCYERGIDVLLQHSKKSEMIGDKQQFNDRIRSYLDRLEVLKVALKVPSPSARSRTGSSGAAFPDSPDTPLDSTLVSLRRKLLDRINSDRKTERLPALILDHAACNVADAHCKEMAQNSYVSHVNLSGLLPYQRYCATGSSDHIIENVGFVDEGIAFHPSDAKEIERLLLAAHSVFMNETPPLDGHRANILTPYHTHVGIGWYCTESQFRLAQIFVDRYAELVTDATQIPSNGEIEVRGRMLREEYGPYALLVYRDPVPQLHEPDELKLEMYRDGDARVSARWPWEITFNADRTFSVKVYISDRQPGMYYFTLLVRDNVKDIPYKVGFGKSQASTEGCVPGAACVLQCI
eukprot:TRINITY_DN6746_c0_g1_i1.p1 TRINITY_DN6746_c0_g1~~TRINITY_DN6746_c0_g1_i1.p1  ORF type:complete len:386 (-),score=58.29 TRINITY_DN6746_c0_g1_i1:780-1910(-)